MVNIYTVLRRWQPLISISIIFIPLLQDEETRSHRKVDERSEATRLAESVLWVSFPPKPDGSFYLDQ